MDQYDVLKDTGIPVVDEDFYCRGQFTALHRGHPDKDDLAKAEKFAKKWIGE